MGVDLTRAFSEGDDAAEVENFLEIRDFRNRRFRGYPSTETTNLNDFIGEGQGLGRILAQTIFILLRKYF